MKLTPVGRLPTQPESRIWYRALQPQFLSSAALATAHTRTLSSRFSDATPANPRFEILYLAENQQVALFEVQALLGSPAAPGNVIPHPRRAWVMMNVTVRLRQVVDLTDVAVQNLLETTAQELTGDWQGYRLRGPATTVQQPTGSAPTQELGLALYQVPSLEGFRTLSARVPYNEVLAVFPAKLQPGSRLEWLNPITGNLESIP